MYQKTAERAPGVALYPALEKFRVRRKIVPDINLAMAVRMGKKKTVRVRVEKAPSQKTSVLRLARREGWEGVRVIGQGGMVDKPVKTNGWIVFEYSDFKIQFPEAIIPQEALDRKELVEKNLDIAGFLIADDAQHQRHQPPPQPANSPRTSPRNSPEIAAGMLAGLSAAAIRAILLDPVLIGVTADRGEWIWLYDWLD